MIPDDPNFYKSLLDHISDGVYFVDRERRILFWNEGAHRLTGYTSEELVGRHCQDDILCHVDYDGQRLCQNDCPLAASIRDGNRHEARVFLRHKQGRRLPVEVRIQPMFGSDGTIVGGVEIFSDDSARLETARKLKDMQRMAFLDDLTQLPNRRFVELSLETACNEFRMHRDPFGVLSIDLDGFKGINDFFGHEMGDFALKETAKTLAGALRASDVVGRWGGDEFIAIVRNTSDELLRVLSARCEALVGQTAIPAPNNRKICPSASIGFALARTDEPWKELVARADELMYRRKKAKRSIVA